VNIGRPKRIIEIAPTELPLPDPAVPLVDPAPAEPVPAEPMPAEPTAVPADPGEPAAPAEPPAAP
jgi:hypothetical protein